MVFQQHLPMASSGRSLSCTESASRPKHDEWLRAVGFSQPFRYEEPIRHRAVRTGLTATLLLYVLVCLPAVHCAWTVNVTCQLRNQFFDGGHLVWRKHRKPKWLLRLLIPSN